MTGGVLLVDDEQSVLDAMQLSLRTGGIERVATCSDPREVLTRVTPAVRVVLLDLVMPWRNGEEVLAELVAERPDVQVIVVTSDSRIETVVRCMRAGAVDFLRKPVNADLLLARTRRALAEASLRDEATALRRRFQDDRLDDPAAFADIVTDDPTMHRLFSYVEVIARSGEPVLITGETGCGKELIARALHQVGPQRGPFVAVNVSGLDGAVFSDVLFGHLPGAYTGTEGPRRGLIDEAGAGTLFLDEIGDLAESAQVKLLRTLQEREYRPLGADRPRPLRARVVAATHRPRASLRPDLYFRLRGYHIRVPPLRERRGDIAALVDRFVQEASTDLDKPPPRVPPAVVRLLEGYPFPGNIRELRSIVYNAVALADESLRAQDLSGTMEPLAQVGYEVPSLPRVLTESEMNDLHRENVLRALEQTRWRVAGSGGAAELLGIPASTLASRMRKLGIRR